MSQRPTRLSAADIRALDEEIYPHPLNINAVRRTRALGEHTGLQQVGVQLVRLTPGHDSTEYHRHHHSDEFVYVLEGRGSARIGAATVTIGPGDFLGFPAGGEPHALSNPYEVDLLYLVGGNRVPVDTVDYPEAGKRLSISGDERRYGALPVDGPDAPDD